jgi:hypothetical protein
MEDEKMKVRKRGDRGPAIVTRLKKGKLEKSTSELLDHAACTLYLLWGNKDKAFRHTAGCAAPASKNAGTIYFKSPKREKAMAIAEVEFEKTLVPHLEAYAKKKGLFFPSEAAVQNSEAKFEAIRRGMNSTKRDRESMLLELNQMADQAGDLDSKLKIMSKIAEIEQMKRAEVEEVKGLPSVVILPQKANITLFGVEMYVDPSKKAYIEREFGKIANPKKFGILSGEDD